VDLPTPGVVGYAGGVFVLSKIFTFLVQPERLAFAGLVVGIALLYTRRWRLGRTILAVLLGASVVLGTVPVSDWLLRALEFRFPVPRPLPEHVDGIIMLGGEINPELTLQNDQPVLGRGAARLLAFANLARRYPSARLIFTGGSGRLFDPSATEAAAMRVAMRAIGMDPDRITFEDKSRNTHENAIFTKPLAAPQPGETWLLVTAAAHMPRAVGCFRAAGFPVIAYPVGFLSSDELDWLFYFRFEEGFRDLWAPLKEYAGLLAYRILGYTNQLFPAP